MKRFCFIVLFFMFALTGLASLHTHRATVTETLPNVYTLRLTDLNDKSFGFQQFKGNVLLISFGATWCTPCREELKALEELTKEYKDKSVKFFWVSLDDRYTSNKELVDFSKVVNFSFQILRDSKSENYLNYSNRYRLPTILFANRDGKVDTPLIFGMFPTAEEYKQHTRRRLNALLETKTKKLQ